MTPAVASAAATDRPEVSRGRAPPEPEQLDLDHDHACGDERDVAARRTIRIGPPARSP
jgi:hypothetical protein